MAETYRTAPLPSADLPRGIPYIVGNEAAERFSFYGMRTILVIYMTKYLLGPDGLRDVMGEDEAKFYFHLFVMSAYFFPIFGALISDVLFGKYRTIIALSIIYCLGHLALAMDDVIYLLKPYLEGTFLAGPSAHYEARYSLAVGLTLIAIGSGGIKPCVSAHVGDQFGTQNQHLLGRVFSWFYFSINLGAFVSTLLTPLLLNNFGPSVAFGVPGVLMLLATWVFWLGRHEFVHVPPGGLESVEEAFSSGGLRAIRYLVPIYLFVAVFWSLFDQTGSAWVLQATRMDRHWLGVEWLPSQIGAVNPILILILIPVFSYAVYPAVNRIFLLTPLRKVAIGFFVTVAAFAVPSWIDGQITGGTIVRFTSEADAERWPAQNLLDGQTDGTGWVSNQRPQADSTASPGSMPQHQAAWFPQEIVIRLRERLAWNIDHVGFHAATDLSDFLQESDPAKTAPTDSEVKSCWAKDVEVLVGSSRQGPWSSVGQIALAQQAEMQSLRFPTVSAEYVLIRIDSNWGGDYVGLGEIEVTSPEPLPADADRHAAAVWPNVAAIGYQPSIVWQLLAYVLLTAAEVMVSITCLEFSYTQAPRKMKSFIMSLYLLSVAAGNAFTALVNYVIQNEDGSSMLEGPDYYWFFTGVMLLAALGFLVVAKTYRGQTYIQDGT